MHMDGLFYSKAGSIFKSRHGASFDDGSESTATGIAARRKWWPRNHSTCQLCQLWLVSLDHVGPCWTMLDLSQETWCLKIGRCVEKSYEVWGSKCLGNCFQHLHASFQHFSTKSRLAPLQLMWKSADLRLPEISPLSKSEENPKNPNENHGARHGEGTRRSNQPQGPRHGQRPVALCSRPKMPATRALRGPPGPKGRLNSGMVDLRNKRHRGTTGMIHQNPSN